MFVIANKSINQTGVNMQKYIEYMQVKKIIHDMESWMECFPIGKLQNLS